MVLPVARTRDEAHLYMDLHPCTECDSIDITWEHATVDAGGELGSAYFGTCPGCGSERDFVFGLPEREWVVAEFPNFGGPEPSQLLDAGEWLYVSDLSARSVPTDEPSQTRRALTIAMKAVAEVIKFIPSGHDEVPDHAFWSDRGRQMRSAKPDRFSRAQLVVLHNAYRRLADQEHR
jgi:hypothetical protein